MGKAEVNLNAFKLSFQHSTPDLSEVIKEEQEWAQLRARAEAVALKTARKRNLDSFFSC